MEAEVAAADLTLIKDEDILRRMWAETEDYGRKKDIRARMYKLREQRLKDFYTSGEVETEITGRKHTTTRHTESIGDQGFLTMKTKEIRDSESPTRDFSRRGNNGYWTSVEERGYTTGNQEGGTLERSEESRKGEGLVIEGNTETRMALTAQNLHEKTSKSDDNMSMKSETSKQNQAFVSSSVTDTGDKISRMETSESENLQSNKKEQTSETSSSSTTKVSSSTSSSRKVVSSSVTSSSYQVTGDETRSLKDNEIKSIKYNDDTSKFASGLRSNEQTNIHQSNLQKTGSHYDDSNNLHLQQPTDQQAGQIQDFNLIKSSTQQTSHDSSQYQNEHSTQSYKTIQNYKTNYSTTSETDKHDLYATDTENQKQTMINSRSDIDDHITKESTVRNDKNVHETKNVHHDEEILRVNNQINRENLDVNEFITNEKIDSSTLRKSTPRSISGPNTPTDQNTAERFTTVREVSNNIRDSTTTQQTKTNTDQKILNEINKLDTYLANQNTPVPSEPVTPKSVTDGAQWTIVSDRDGEFIYQNDKSPRDNTSHPVQPREPIVKHPSSLDLPKDATDGQYVTTYQQSYNRISVDNSPSHEFFVKTLRASPDRLTPSPTKSSRGSLDRNSPDRRLRAASKGSLDRSSPETNKKRSYSKGSLDRSTPERSYRTSPSKTPDRERRGSSESYTIEKKKDSNTIERKIDSNTIERKKNSNTIERKIDSNTLERKKNSSTIERKIESNTLERKKDTNSIDRKKDSHVIEKKIDTNTFDRKKDSRRKTTEITQQMVRDTTNKTKRKFSSTQQKAANKTRISTPGVSPSTSPTRTVSKKEVTSGSESDISQATYNKTSSVKSVHDTSVITSKTDKGENITESTLVTSKDTAPNRSKPRDKSPEYSSEGSVSREINKSLKTRSDINTSNNSFKPISQTTTDHSTGNFILEEQKNSVREITEETSDYSDTQKKVDQKKVIHDNYPTTDQHSDTDEVLETDSIDGESNIIKNKRTTKKISDEQLKISSSPEHYPEEIQRPDKEIKHPKSSPENKVSLTPKSSISPERKAKDSSDRQPLRQLNQKRPVDSPSSTLERKPKVSVSTRTAQNLNQRPEHSPSPSPERCHQPASKLVENKTQRTLDENRQSVSSSPERRYPQSTKETNSEKYQHTSNRFISEEKRSENRERSISSSPERKPTKQAQKTSHKTDNNFAEKSPLSRQQRPSSPHSSPERNASPERRPTKLSQKTSPRTPEKKISQKSPISHQQRPSPSTSPERNSSPERRPTKPIQKTSPKTVNKKLGEKSHNSHQQRPSPSTSPERNISPERIVKPAEKTSHRNSEKISSKSLASHQQRPISPYSSPERYSSPDRKKNSTQQKKNSTPITNKQTPKTGIPTTQRTTQKTMKETVRVTKHSSIPRANKLSPRNSKDKIETINNRNSTQVIRKSTPIPKAQQIVKVTSVTRTTSKINEHKQEISKPSQVKSPHVSRTPVETNPKRSPSKIATPKYIQNKPKTPDLLTRKPTNQKISKTTPKTLVNNKRSPQTPSKKTTNIIEDIEITENIAVNQRTAENTEFLNNERSNLDLEDENPPEEYFDEYDDRTDDTSPDRQPKSHRTTDDIIVNVTTVKTTARKSKTRDSNINNTSKIAPKITKPKQDIILSEKRLSGKKTQYIQETISDKKTLRKLKKEQKIPKDMGSSSSSSSSEEEEIEQSDLEELRSCELKNSDLVTHTSNQDLLTVVVQHPKSSRESSPGYPSAGQPFCTTSEDGESNPRYADYIVEPDDVELFDKHQGPVTPIRLTEDESIDVKSVADRVNVFLEATRLTNETVTQPEVVSVSSPKSVLKAKSMFENIAKNQTTNSNKKPTPNKKPTDKRPKSPVEDQTPKYSPSQMMTTTNKECTTKPHNYDDIVTNEEINIQHTISKSFIEDEITAQLRSDKPIISNESPQTLKQTKPDKEQPCTKKTSEKKPVGSVVDVLSKRYSLEKTSHEEVNILEEIKNDINEQITRDLLEEETEEVYNLADETTPKGSTNKLKSPSPQRQLPKSGPKDTSDTRKPTERKPYGTVGTKKELFESKSDQIEINQQQNIKRTIEDITVQRQSSKSDVTTRRPSLKEKSPSPQRTPSQPKEHTDSKKPFERKPSVHVDVSSKKDFFERKVKDISVSASKSTPKKKEQSLPKSKPLSQPSSKVLTPETHRETRQKTVTNSTVNTSIEFGEPEKRIHHTQTDDEQQSSETTRKTSHLQKIEQKLSKTEHVIISSETDELNEVNKFEPDYQRALETEQPTRKTSKPEEIVRKPSKPQDIIRTPTTEDFKSRPVDENRPQIRAESYMRSTTSSSKRDHTPEKNREEIVRKTPDDIARKPSKPQEIIRTPKTEDVKSKPFDENRSHTRTESYMRSTKSSSKRDPTPEKQPEEIIRKTSKPGEIIRRPSSRTDSYMKNTITSSVRSHTPEYHTSEPIRKPSKTDHPDSRTTKTSESSIVHYHYENSDNTSQTRQTDVTDESENIALRRESYMRSTESSRGHTPDKQSRGRSPDTYQTRQTDVTDDSENIALRRESYMRSTESSRGHTPDKHSRGRSPDTYQTRQTDVTDDSENTALRRESYMRSTDSSRGHTSDKHSNVRSPDTYQTRETDVTDDSESIALRRESYMRSTDSSRGHTSDKHSNVRSPDTYQTRETDVTDDSESIALRRESYMRSTDSSRGHTSDKHSNVRSPDTYQTKQTDVTDDSESIALRRESYMRTTESSRGHAPDKQSRGRSPDTYQTRQTDVTDDSENISSRTESYMRTTESSRGHTPDKHSSRKSPEITRMPHPQSPIKPVEMRRQSGSGEVLEDTAMRRTSTRTETKQEVGGKFGVTLRKTPSTTKMATKPAIQRQNSKPSDILDIESIFDLELLEEMLLKAVGYDDRRRIRAQIRVVKKDVEDEKNRAVITKVTKTPSIQSTLPSVRDIKKQASPSKSPDTHGPAYNTPKSSLERRVPAHSPTRSSPERRVPTHSPRSSPERRVPTHSPTRSPEKRVPTHSSRASPERRVKAGSPEKQYPERSPTRRVSSERPLTNGYKDSRTITETTTVRTQSIRKSTTSDTKETCPTDLITSSYGVGPTDENGRPLFGLKALRRTSTNKALTGETVEQETVTEVGEESSLFGLRALQQTSTDNMPAESSQLRELVERHQQYVRESSSKDLQPVQKPKAKLRDSFILTQEDDVTSVIQSELDDDAKSLSLKSIIQKHENNTGSNVKRTMESTSTVVKSRSTVSSDGKVSLHRDVIHGEVSSKNNEEPHGKVTRSSYSYQSPKDRNSQPSITSSTTTSQIGSRRNSGPRIEEITDTSTSETSRRYSKEYTVEEEEVVSDQRRSSGVSVDENVKTYTSILKNSNAPGRRSSGPRITDVSDVSSEQEERRSSITKTSASSRVASDTTDSKIPFSSRQQSSESKTDGPKKVITRGDSVKALQHKFQQATEAANQPATRPYPRAGLILRSNTLQHIDDQTQMSSSTKQSSSVERTSSKSKQHLKETKSHDVPSSPVLKTQVITQDDSEIVQTTQVSRPEETTSFLDNKTKVTGVQDILTRMRNADLVTEKTDTTEDAEARALLNKFLGASVILQGMEQGMRASQKHTEVEGPTSPTSASLVIQAEKQWVKATSVGTLEDDIDNINDEKQLRILLDACSDYDSRRKLRARLRTIMADQKGGPEDVEESHVISESSSEVVKQGDTIVKTEVQSRTTSSSAKLTKANSVQSPFAKFRQLERQNSAPSAGRPPPLFKFTEPKLAQSASTIKERLLNWVQAQTRHYKNIQIENFSTSWSNGLAFCALIHHFCPTAFDYDSLTPDKRRYNFELAFRVAEEEADIFPLLDVEDMVVLRKPDWKCVFTYVQSIYRRFHDSPDALPVF